MSQEERGVVTLGTKVCEKNVLLNVLSVLAYCLSCEKDCWFDFESLLWYKKSVDIKVTE